PSDRSCTDASANSPLRADEKRSRSRRSRSNRHRTRVACKKLNNRGPLRLVRFRAARERAARGRAARTIRIHFGRRELAQRAWHFLFRPALFPARRHRFRVAITVFPDRPDVRRQDAVELGDQSRRSFPLPFAASDMKQTRPARLLLGTQKTFSWR